MEGFEDLIRFVEKELEKEITESERNEMSSRLKTMQERNDSNEFLGSSICWEWTRERDQLFYEDCAKIGLAQYNAQNGTNFKLDKLCCEGPYFGPVVIFHLNFIAESSDGSNDEKKSCMFFAEVVGLEERVVTVCCKLDPVAGTDGFCGHCGCRVSHPRGCSFSGSRPT